MSTESIVTAFLDRLGAQDAEGIGALFADQVDWYVPGHDALPWTGARSRSEDVPEYFRTMWPRFVPGASEVSLDKVLIDGDSAAIFATFEHTVAENGNRFRTPVAMRLDVSDDQIVRMHLFEDTGAVSDAFFGARQAPSIA
jgi:ketosteroid isomerase-like protein